MSDRASREDLQELHRLLAETFLQYLRDTPAEKRRASMLEVIRSFIKDNGIAKDLESHKDVQTSLEALSSIDIPFFND